MKRTAVFSVLAFLSFFIVVAHANIPATLKSREEVAETKDVCLNCFSDIELAIEDCNDNETSTFTCITDSLDAASECTECICVIANIFEGGDADCEDPDPGVCTNCATMIDDSILDCSNENVTDIDCVIDVLGATSECISCICEIVDIFGAESDQVDCDDKVLKAQQLAIEKSKAKKSTTNVPATLKSKSEIVETRDVCLNCFADIDVAVDICNDNETSTLECIVDSLDAASECTECVCVIVNIFEGGDGACEDPDPGACTICAEDIEIAIEECNSDDVTDLNCMFDILGATSECIECICEIYEIFDAEGDVECETRILEAQQAYLKNQRDVFLVAKEN